MDLVKVKMKKDQDGSPDGLSVRTYEKDKTYDLPSDLANAFVSMKVAEEVSAGPNEGTVDWFKLKLTEAGVDFAQDAKKDDLAALYNDLDK